MSSVILCCLSAAFGLFELGNPVFVSAAFGFCEFGNPDAALRAIRLLHDLDVSDKKLVAKVDSKTQEVLEKYKVSRPSHMPYNE